MHEFSLLPIKRAPRLKAMADVWPRAAQGDTLCHFPGSDVNDSLSRRRHLRQPLPSHFQT
jgi:hypothetical protein